MSLTKSGVSIECEQCHCLSSDDKGGFDIIVPVQDSKTGLSGISKLHCQVSSQEHKVEIIELRDTNSQLIVPSEDVKNRLNKALEFIAEHQVCGNQKICPADVVRVVESFNHSAWLMSRQ